MGIGMDVSKFNWVVGNSYLRRDGGNATCLALTYGVDETHVLLKSESYGGEYAVDKESGRARCCCSCCAADIVSAEPDEDINKRIEQLDKRIEQLDKRLADLYAALK